MKSLTCVCKGRCSLLECATLVRVKCGYGGVSNADIVRVADFICIVKRLGGFARQLSEYLMYLNLQPTVRIETLDQSEGRHLVHLSSLQIYRFPGQHARRMSHRSALALDVTLQRKYTEKVSGPEETIEHRPPPHRH